MWLRSFRAAFSRCRWWRRCAWAEKDRYLHSKFGGVVWFINHPILLGYPILTYTKYYIPKIYSRNVGLNQKKYWQNVYQRKKIRITQTIQQECQPQTGIDQKSDIQSKLLPFWCGKIRSFEALDFSAAYLICFEGQTKIPSGGFADGHWVKLQSPKHGIE